MLLDDQIVKIVLEDNPQNFEEEKVVLSKIIKLCLDKICNEIKSNMSNENFVVTVKQVFNAWDSATRELNKKGKPLLKEGGLKSYILSKKELADILNEYGFK